MTESPIFAETFTVTTDNPLLRGHVVYGHSLMPGVGYVDLVLQVLARHGHPMPEVELRNLTIHAPLVAAPGEQVLTTVEGRPAPSDGWRIEVRSRRPQDTADVLHAVVTVHRPARSPFEERLSLPVTGATRLTSLADLYTWCKEHELVHSGLMKVDGALHHCPGDWVAELELAPAHSGGAGGFLFHPALLEAALLCGGVASGLLNQKDGGPGLQLPPVFELYLPMVFRSFRATASPGGRCFVRVPADSVRRDDELVRLAMEFYDPTGTKIAEIGQYVGKRVRAGTTLGIRDEPVTAAASTSPPAPSPAGTETVLATVGQDLVAVLRDLFAAHLGQPAARIGINVGYYELGLTSAGLLSLVAELEDRLSLSLSPTIMFEHRTIADLAAWLERLVAERAVASGAAAAAQTTVAQPDTAVAARSGTVSADLLSAVRAALTDEVSALLKVSAQEVHPDGELTEFGFDWTGLAQLADGLNDRYGLALTPTVFLEHRTVQDMAAYLVDAHREHVEVGHASSGETRGAGKRPHPMLHRSLRDGDDIVYETRFDGTEPYLRDHQVRGGLVLPGAAQLEMARAAVARALDEEHTGRVRLEDIVWLRPAICGPNGLELRVTVRTAPRGGCEYEIHGMDDNGGRVLCSQGRASLSGAGDRHLPLLDDLRADCAQTQFSAERVYGLYAAAGLDYGPAQRSLVRLGVGTDDSGQPQVLAELRLPTAAEPLDQCLLHPSIVDGALQATIGLRLAAARSGGQSTGAALPFALQLVEAVAATPTRAYAWIRHQPGSGPDAASARLDITVLDEHGRVCADLTGLSTRLLPDPPQTAHGTPQSELFPGPVRHPAARDRVGAGGPTIVGPRHSRTDIAIIGVSGRYPESADLNEFWNNLRSGRDCISEVPAERWEHHRYGDGSDTGPTPAKWGGFLDGIDRFDPLFFSISLLEAEYLDPQERLFLECAHHVLEDAGYTGELLARTAARQGATTADSAPSGRVGVFVGAMYHEYQLFGAQAQERGHPLAVSGSAATISNRVSYFYDFTGPSMTIDTMCSGSLTAIHLACEAIKSGQCEAALAGGVNLSSHPNKYLLLGMRNFLSSDGRCRSFGDGGDGYVPGEGVGAVLLKPLERAVADGDHIYGVIKGTAVNHGGRASGYSVPSPVAQGEVIADALADAGVDSRALSYIEAHGTGTALGDPIEISGLTKGLSRAGGLPQDCAIGSVKSNIGHSESAAGIAGVTKVLLQMRHGELVPSLHSGTLNPHIDFDHTPLRVQQRLESWRRPTLEIDGERRTFARIAGVSAFGAGGSNAHVVIAEYEPQATSTASSSSEGPPALLVLSAKSEDQLVEQARRLRARLAELDDGDLLDVAWTLQTGRMALEERVAFAATSLQAARSRLEAFVSDPSRPGPWTRGTARMGREASAAHPDSEEMSSALRDWTERGVYGDLLGLWAEGAPVEWEKAHSSGRPPRRVSLPGYPFARERCWLDLATVPAPDTGGAPHTPPAPHAADRAEPEAGPAGPPAESGEMVLLRPVWTAREAVASVGPAPAAAGEAYAEHHVVVVGRLTAGERDALRTDLPASAVCRFVEFADGPLDRQYTEVTRQMFTLTRAILEGGVRRPVLLQVALVGAETTADGRERLACFGGLAGLLKTARLENPLLHTQYLECLDGVPSATLAARLVAETAHGSEPEVRHRDGVRYLGRLEEVPSARPAAAPWKEGGVYLVSGGAGGLGLIVAREIAASVGHATVVLTGRSPLTETRRGSLDALRAAGLTVDYQRADVADRAAVARLLTHVADRYGPLTGVLHSAGVINDGLFIRKTPQELVGVLAPKVAGVVNLDELTRDQPLETFLCFSSTSGAFGNPGQADYAAANAFMDAYTVYRNSLVDAGLRSGRTVSVNWPLWDEGAMGADGAVREHLRSLGLAPLDTARGLRALRCARAAEENGLADGRLLVLVGRRSALLSRLTGPDEEPGKGPDVPGTRPVHREPPAGPSLEPFVRPASGTGPAGAPEDAGLALEDRAVDHLRRLLAGTLKLAPERLEADTPLERYGMDSVIAVTVVTRLEESFGPLSRTLLFEAPTVRELARYFAADHTPTLRSLVGEPTAPVPAPPVADTAGVPPVPEAPAHPSHREDDGKRAEETMRGVRDREVGPAPGVPRHGRDQDIAIVGISGRYPQAEGLDTFWANLRDGKDCVTKIPDDRWERLYGNRPDGAGTAEGPWGAFLDGIDRFDPLHFGMAPSEAAVADPQQRLFLETVWHLLEQSGVTQEVIERRYRRRVGVYVGAAYQMYRADRSNPVLAALTSAASYNLIANSVSSFFGLEGPSLAIDTMCTSSTMAVHLACADLQRGESELAIAGGVNLTVHPDKFLALSEMQLLGSHPGSRSFRDGDGYLPAEAVGALLLKPLDAAIRDGDTIHAVIKGTASSHSGRANGFMTPSHRSQVEVMRRALERAGAEPDSIGYVEASASGAALADEVEISAMKEVFRGVSEPVTVGTVKSSLGHPEAASGIAQITKVVLQLRHGELTPLAEVGSPNPNLRVDGTSLRLGDRLAPWKPRGTTGADGRSAPRRALINSVAAGGSHVGLVVEAPPPTDTVPTVPGDTGPQLVVLSGRTPERLRTAARRLHDFLEAGGSTSLADLAYTTQLGREPLPERLAVVAGTLEELRRALAHHLASGSGEADAAGTATAVQVHLGNAEESADPLGTSLTGARGEAFLSGLVEDGALRHIAELWVRGAKVPWSGLHRESRRLVPLPATAFEPGRYWIGLGSHAPVAATPGAPSGVDTARSARRETAGRPEDPTLTDAEQTLASAWAELLGVEAGDLGATSNFFSLGGNSLLANRLINLLKRQFGAELPVQAVFDAPRLAEMAAELERRERAREAADGHEADLILESIGLIERMSDEELNALVVEN